MTWISFLDLIKTLGKTFNPYHGYA